MSEISRRDFLKGSGAAALTVALAGLTGCTPKESSPTTTPEQQGTPTAQPTPNPGPAASEQDKLYTAYINPQREDYRSNTKELKTLFSPLKIGAIQLNHRMVKSAAGSATHLKGLGEELVQYYVNMAKGGVELLCVESIPALEVPADGSGYSAETLAFGQHMVAECAKYGACLVYQISGFSKGENEMTVEDIHAKQERYTAVAKGMQELGFKGVEINCAGFNMGAHFVSRFHNARTDEYGCGSIEDRARFVTECIEKIKTACGKDFNVQILFDAIEENDNLANNPTVMTLDVAVTVPHTRSTPLRTASPWPSSSRRRAPTPSTCASGLWAITWPSSPATCTSSSMASRVSPALVPSMTSSVTGRARSSGIPTAPACC